MPCFPSLARAEKKLLRLAGEVARRAGGVFHPRIIPQGKQNGHYGRRKGNKRGVMAAARETKGALRPRKGSKTAIMAAARRAEGALRPRGGEPPPSLRGSSPCEAGQFFPAGFDCRHSEVCKSRNSVSLNSFFQMVLNPQECGLSPKAHTKTTHQTGELFAEIQNSFSNFF